MIKLLAICLSSFLWVSLISAQETSGYTWYHPLKSLNQIDGQGWSDKAEKVVRNPVWLLSRHSAGLSVRFTTNADSIKVQYEVDGNITVNHMPATGVNGVDLYGKNSKGQWLWYREKNTFDSIIQFHFKTKKVGKEAANTYYIYPCTITAKT